MFLHVALLSCLALMGGDVSIQFKKFDADSIAEIWPSEEGYTSRSTNGIVVEMKNGDTTTILYDKNGHLSPGTLKVSKNKKWFTIANPNWGHKKGNCSPLLCSLPNGLCKCGDVVADAGFSFWNIIDSTGGCRLYEDDKPQGKSKGKQKKRASIILPDEEMSKRFLADFNKSPRIF